VALPPGCNFAPRCRHRFDRCDSEDPVLTDAVGGSHLDACLLSVDHKRAVRDADINPGLVEGIA
jgi:peptide/nickel transport system ATP-binding protein/oligopeptide transport system ATP-binding protein